MWRCKSGKLSGIFLLLNLFYGSIGVVAADSLKFCEKELEALENSTSDVGKLIERWLALEDKCKGTGFYEYRLSKFYINAGDYVESEIAIDNGLKYETPFKKELLLAKGDIFLHGKKYAKAEKAYRFVTEQFPDWYAGFNYLGFALFAQGRNKEAVGILDKANDLEETADTYRTLTLVHHLLGNHKTAVESLNRAFSMDESVLSDRDPMVAGIRSYAELGNYEISRKLLAILLSRNPEIKSDKEYLKAGLFLRQKMIDAGLVEE